MMIVFSYAFFCEMFENLRAKIDIFCETALPFSKKCLYLWFDSANKTSEVFHFHNPVQAITQCEKLNVRRVYRIKTVTLRF